MEKLKTWQFIEGNLAKGENVILVSVLDSKGGSPGKSGFKLAVTRNELAGSVGGGAMEFNIINETRACLSDGITIREIRKLYHNKNSAKHQSGLICTGNQTICIYSLSQAEHETVKSICGAIQNNIPVVLKASNEKFEISSKIIEGIKFNLKASGEFSYTEEIPAGDLIYIAGGGHVGRAVSVLMKTLDFRIKAIDPRPDIIEGLINLLPEEKILINFEDSGELIEEGKNIFVVILTSSYLTDKAVLQQVLSKKIRYIGMMGSAAKIKRVYDELKADGVDPELFNKVHAPIGLEINSLTPAEIAVSIAAEIIKAKNSV